MQANPSPRKRKLFMALLCGWLALGALPTSSLAFENTMAERTRACTACHGDQGRAGPDGYYPRLAGKPAGYLFNQLENFQHGRRQYGLMQGLIDPLSRDYLRAMAVYFSELHIPYPPPAPATAPPAAPVESVDRGQPCARRNAGSADDLKALHSDGESGNCAPEGPFGSPHVAEPARHSRR